MAAEWRTPVSTSNNNELELMYLEDTSLAMVSAVFDLSRLKKIHQVSLGGAACERQSLPHEWERYDAKYISNVCDRVPPIRTNELYIEYRCVSLRDVTAFLCNRVFMRESLLQWEALLFLIVKGTNLTLSNVSIIFRPLEENDFKSRVSGPLPENWAPLKILDLISFRSVSSDEDIRAVQCSRVPIFRSYGGVNPYIFELK